MVLFFFSIHSLICENTDFLSIFCLQGIGGITTAGSDQKCFLVNFIGAKERLQNAIFLSVRKDGLSYLH